MKKSALIGFAIAAFLLIGALFVSANLEAEPAPVVAEEVVEPASTPACGEQGCNAGTCGGSCGGSCGVPSCGCGR